MNKKILVLLISVSINVVSCGRRETHISTRVDEHNKMKSSARGDMTQAISKYNSTTLGSGSAEIDLREMSVEQALLEFGEPRTKSNGPSNDFKIKKKGLGDRAEVDFDQEIIYGDLENVEYYLLAKNGKIIKAYAFWSGY